MALNSDVFDKLEEERMAILDKLEKERRAVDDKHAENLKNLHESHMKDRLSLFRSLKEERDAFVQTQMKTMSRAISRQSSPWVPYSASPETSDSPPSKRKKTDVIK